jgi:NAD(P)-dependent dehydrogenase (short-subunit alcohol dehydrogenase family)
VAVAHHCDISNEADVQAAAAATAAHFGSKTHVLVNNAASFIFKRCASQRTAEPCPQLTSFALLFCLLTPWFYPLVCTCA